MAGIPGIYEVVGMAVVVVGAAVVLAVVVAVPGSQWLHDFLQFWAIQPALATHSPADAQPSQSESLSTLLHDSGIGNYFINI